MHIVKSTGEVKALLYIPKKYIKLFEELEKEAEMAERGLGYFICKMYEDRKKGVKI